MSKELYELSYSMRQARNRFIRNTVLICLAVYIFLNLILCFLVIPYQDRSISMEPNIKRNSLIFVTPATRKIKRGEIVVIDNSTRKLSFFQNQINIFCGFISLQKWRPYSDTKTMNEASFMRRVAGLPGDTLYMKDYILYIMPEGQKHFLTEFELTDIPYNVDIMIPPSGWNKATGVQGNIDKITLGPNEYFVLSDNRLSSIDSRLTGPVEDSHIKYRALLAYFPFNHLRKY